MNKIVLLSIFICLCHSLSAQSFVRSEGTHFMLDGQPYYFIGANYWQGALLGSKAEGGDRRRLRRELKQLQKMGVTNLRILVGAEGPDDQPHRVTPALQTASGQYNENLFEGLDYLLRQMKKHDLKAVLFLTNSWEWSGGFAQYLNWNGYGPIPYPQENTWPTFMQYIGQYYACPPCQEQFFQHVRTVLGRTNRYTGVRYVDDPTIMAWEVANEPRAFTVDNLPAMQTWIEQTVGVIKSLDNNHLVTTGSEGSWGCENSLDWFERVHAFSGVDYMTVHIWPKNWSWINSNDIPGTLDTAIALTNQYLDLHLAVAQRLQKPLVLEEFGLPRDGHVFTLKSTTQSRDRYYENAFARVVAQAGFGQALAGCNFWAFAGRAKPSAGDPMWAKGEDLSGDPPQEEQGLNSVFGGDATVELVKRYAKLVREASAGYLNREKKQEGNGVLGK